MSRSAGATQSQTQHVDLLRRAEVLLLHGVTIPEMCDTLDVADKSARRIIGALGALGLRVTETRRDGPSVFRASKSTAIFRPRK